MAARAVFHRQKGFAGIVLICPPGETGFAVSMQALPVSSGSRGDNGIHGMSSVGMNVAGSIVSQNRKAAMQRMKTKKALIQMNQDQNHGCGGRI